VEKVEEEKRGRYIIFVGVIPKMLDEDTEVNAIAQARAEAARVKNQGVNVSLIEQTANHGAVNVSFR